VGICFRVRLGMGPCTRAGFILDSRMGPKFLGWASRSFAGDGADDGNVGRFADDSVRDDDSP